MKKLSEVTQEDAIIILEEGYPGFFTHGKWKLTDEEKDIREPCKKLFSRTKHFQFWFFDDCIDIEPVSTPDSVFELSDWVYDVKYTCYLKAAELGYYVPILSNMIQNTILT